MSFPKSGAMLPRAQGLAAIQLARVCPSVPSTIAGPLGCVPILYSRGCIRQVGTKRPQSRSEQMLRLSLPWCIRSVPSIATALLQRMPLLCAEGAHHCCMITLSSLFG